MLKKFFKNPLRVFFVLPFLVLGGSLLFAAPPNSPYGPGDTLDPGCAPGDANCSVTTSADLSTRNSDDLEEGIENLYYTADRVSNHIDVLANTTARHGALTLAGSNYLSLSGQELTAGVIDISTHTNLATGSGLLLTDDTLSASGLSVGNFTSANISQWTNDSGYISSYIETDPVFGASSASDISGGDIVNWDLAYGWGNHALQGYYGSSNPVRLSYVEEGSFATDYNTPAVNNSTSTGWEARVTATESGTFQYIKHSGNSSPELYRLDIYEANESWVKGDLVTSALGESTEVINTENHVVFNADFNFFAGQNYIFEMPRPTGSARNFVFSTDPVVANNTHAMGPLSIIRQRGPSSNTYSVAWQFYNSENIPKGVVGPLDPVDLPGYGLATEGQVLARTAGGVGFVDQMSGLIAEIDYVDGEEERNDGASTTSSSYSGSYGQLQALDDFSLGKVTFESNTGGQHTLEIQSSTGLETYRTATTSGGPGWITFELDEAFNLAAGSTYRFSFTNPSNTNVRYSSSAYSGSLWAMSSIHFVGFGNFSGSLSMGLIPRELGAESGVPILALSTNGTVSFSEFNGTLTLGVTPVDTSYLDLTDTPDTFTSNAIPYIDSLGETILHSSNLVFDGNRLGVGIDSPLEGLHVLGSNIRIQEVLEDGWDLSNASYDDVSFGVSGQMSSPSGITFSSDGTSMYIVGYGGSSVHQYSLSTPWDLSTTSYTLASVNVSGYEGFASGVAFSGDGVKMYVVGSSSDSVHQHTLSTPWDLSTATYDSVSMSVADQDAGPNGITFKPDGAYMYVAGFGGDAVYQYSLSTPWDLTTASFDSTLLNVSAQSTNPADLAFKQDGTKLYVVGYNADRVYQYSLSSAWDLSTATYDSLSLDVSTLEDNPQGIAIKPDGTKMYIVGSFDRAVLQYTLAGETVGGSLIVDGDVLAGASMYATSFVNTSTEEAKGNIAMLSFERERDMLNDIRTLDIANYRYLTDEVGEPLRLGLIAERSPSDILSRDGKGIDLYKLSTFTVAGLKSLIEKVDRIENSLLIEGIHLESGDTISLGSSEQNLFSQALKKIGLVVNSGVLSLKKLIGQEVQTERLCIGETCVTEGELIDLLQNSGVKPDTQEVEADDENPAAEETEVTPEAEPETDTSEEIESLDDLDLELELEDDDSEPLEEEETAIPDENNEL